MLKTILLICTVVCIGACHQPAHEPEKTTPVVADNAELRALYEQDQADRSDGFDSIDWAKTSLRDSLRRVRVRKLLDSSKVITSEDYHNAAMVFQHGSDTTTARLAFELAQQAVELDSANSNAKWLMAAAWDRYQMRRGEPQWYGTQYVKDSPEESWRLYEIDTTAVTDEERQRLGVPSLSASRARVVEMNQEKGTK